MPYAYPTPGDTRNGSLAFPWPPGAEPATRAVAAIAAAARELVEKRERWLNPAVDERRPTTDDRAKPPASVVSGRSSSDRT